MIEVDQPYSIPEHWAWRRLDEVGEVKSGSTPSTSEEENFGGDIPWLTPNDLSGFEGKYVCRGERNLSQNGLDTCSAVLLPPDTVLFSSRAPIGYVAIAANPIATNQGFKNLIPGDTVESEYVYHYLKGNTALAESYASGTTFKELSATRFSRIPIPVPPESEQRRIVSKIEELFSNLDAGLDSLKKAKRQLERYRLSVLQAAVEGRLTVEWRRTHNPVPAANLIQRAVEQNGVNKYKDRGKMAPLPDQPPFQVPERWRWVRVGDVARRIRYGTSEKAAREYEGVPVLRMGNIGAGRLTYDDLKFMPKGWSDEEKFLLEDGDVLFNRTNSAELVGKTAVYKENHPRAVFASYLVRVRLYPDIYSPDFLAYYINSAHGRAYIRRVTSQQVGQANVNATKLASMPLPLPPVAEQKRITEGVERLLSIVENSAATSSSEVKRASRLRQSILRNAFSGALISGLE